MAWKRRPSRISRLRDACWHSPNVISARIAAVLLFARHMMAVGRNASSFRFPHTRYTATDADMGREPARDAKGSQEIVVLSNVANTVHACGLDLAGM
jgi:hypothetical protein